MQRWLALASLMLAACGTRTVAVQIGLPGEPLDEAAYELSVRAGECGASLADHLAGSVDAPLREVRWREGEAPEAVGSLSPGTYAVTVIVRDSACSPVRFGCVAYRGDSDLIRIDPAADRSAAAGCEGSLACDRGLCASGALDAGIVDGGPPPDGDAGDGGGGTPDAGPQCTDALACGPGGVGRCADGLCSQCPATRLLPVTFPDSGRGFGLEIALEAYEIIEQPWSWVVLRDNAGPSHLWNRQVQIDAHRDTSMWVQPREFVHFGLDDLGPEIIEPDGVALMRDPVDNDIWITALAEVDGTRRVVSGRMFNGWLYQHTTTQFPLGPGFTTRQLDQQVRYGWRAAQDAGGANLRSLRSNDLVGPANGMVTVSAEPPGHASGSDGAFMVASDGARLEFWAPEVSGTTQRVMRTDGDGPASLTYETGDRYVLAYADGSSIRVRRLRCATDCDLDPMDPADAVISRANPASHVHVASLPGGGVALTWVETVTGESLVYAQILPDRLDAAGVETIEVASVAEPRVINDIATDTLLYRGELFVPMVLIAGAPGSASDFASYFGLRFRQDACP